MNDHGAVNVYHIWWVLSDHMITVRDMDSTLTLNKIAPPTSMYSRGESFLRETR